MFALLRQLYYWWYSGGIAPWRWRIYFYFHLSAATWVTVLVLLDRKGMHDAFTHGLWAIPGLISIASYLPAPFLSLRLLYLARKGGPSYIVLALADIFICVVHHIALQIGYS